MSITLHLGMDGSSLNNTFQWKLFDELYEKEDTVFLKLGMCCLHKVHNGYKTALKKIEINQFAAVEILYFFKLSSTRWEDYIRVEERCLICINITALLILSICKISFFEFCRYKSWN